MKTKLTFNEFYKNYTKNPNKWTYGWHEGKYVDLDYPNLYYQTNNGLVLIQMGFFDRIRTYKFFNKIEKIKDLEGYSKILDTIIEETEEKN